ncbi:unnamed protein product, partial [Oikopleura dioica]
VQERERGVTIQSAVVSFENKNPETGLVTKYNIFDTPGHADFIYEVERVLPVALLILDSCRGVETQTKAVLRLARKHNIPIMVFANKIDKFNSNPSYSLESLEKFGMNPISLQIIDENKNIEDNLESDDVIERISNCDDLICEKYLNGEIFSRSEILDAIRAAHGRCEVTPVIFGSSKNNLGLKELIEYLGAFDHRCEKEDFMGSSFVFKITNDRRLGEIAMLRNFGDNSLSLKSTKSLLNLSSENNSIATKKTKLFSVDGAAFEPANDIQADDIFVLSNFENLKTGDFVRNKKAKPSDRKFANFLKARQASCSVVLEVEKQGKEQQLLAGLEVLCKEDPSLSFMESEETGEIILRGMGPFHLEIAISRLETEHRVKDIYQYPVRVDYREVPQSYVLYVASVTDNHLGRDTAINFELELVPQDVVTEFSMKNIIFESNSVGQDIDGKISNIENFAKEFKIRKLIEEGVIMAVMAGPVEKNPVIGFDLRIKRIESQNCFFKQIKGFIVQKMIIRAIQEALKRANCVVKEPRMKFQLSLYSIEHRGKVMELLAENDCEILSEDPEGEMWSISGLLNVSQELKIQKRLLAVTRGNAYLETSYYGL